MSLSINKSAITVQKVTVIDQAGKKSYPTSLSAGDNIVWRKPIGPLVTALNNGETFTDREITNWCNGRYGCLIKVAAGKTVTVKFNNSSSYQYTVGDTSTTVATWFWQDAGVKYTNLMNAFSGQADLVEVGFLYVPNTVTANLQSVFYNCTELRKVNSVGWDMSSTNRVYMLFKDCSNLAEVAGIESWDMHQAYGGVQDVFTNCYKLVVDKIRWILPRWSSMSWVFAGCNSITSLDIGTWELHDLMLYNKVLPPNLVNLTGTMVDIGCFGLSSDSTITAFQDNSKLTRDSAMVIINGLYDLVGNGSSLTHTLKLHRTVFSLLSDDDKAVGTNKGWIIAST